MNKLFAALIAFGLIVTSQATAQAVPVYPANPTIATTKQVGWTVVWTWVAPTQNVDGSAITGALTYDVWMSTGGAFTELASGLTATQYPETNLPLGTPCIYVVAEEAGSNTIPSQPSGFACVTVTAPPAPKVQPNSPSNVSGY